MKKQPTFIDLFCGCGGWTEGFSQLGYQCLYSVDFWAPAALAHSINHPGIEDDDRAKNILDPVVAQTIKDKLLSGEVDVLIGSPPCTQFSFSNRGGGGNTVEGMLLVRRFLEFVDYVQDDLEKADFPWVMENVPRLKVFLEKERINDFENIYRMNYVDEPEMFYEVRIPKVVIMNSADYGAPQKRRRVFCGNFSIPKPTHASPEVKADMRKRQEFIENYEITEAEFAALQDWRTLGDILKGMPNPLETTTTEMVTDPNYPFLEIKTSELHDHFYDTRLRAGMELFDSQLMKQHHPVYGVMNFPDSEDQPARTVMATEMGVSRETIIVPTKRGYKPATLGKRPYVDVLKEQIGPESGGYRRLTIRELACLQGFPITYQLSGKTTGTKHKQIGNAVSPYISRAFGRMFAETYLKRSDIADKNKLKLSRPADISEFDSYEFVADWTTHAYKKKSERFYAHLRTTKADGQRLDLMLDESSKDRWQALLCLGSGKSYKRTRVDKALIKELIATVAEGQSKFNGEFEQWIVEVNKQISSRDVGRFLDFQVEGNFDKEGGLADDSPIFVLEGGLDSIIRETVNGAYDGLRKTTADVEFSEFGFTRPINLYTVMAAAALEELTRTVNTCKV